MRNKKDNFTLAMGIAIGLIVAVLSVGISIIIGNVVSNKTVVENAALGTEDDSEELAAPATIDTESVADSVEIEAGAAEILEESEEPEDSEALAEELAQYVYDPSEESLDGIFKVPEEWANERGGVFVKRDDGLYTITNLIPRYVAETYGVGYSVGSDATEDMMLYLYDGSEGVQEEIPTNTRRAVITAGDFSVLKVSKNEEIIMYSDRSAESITLSKAEFVGYTIPACDRTGHMYYPTFDRVYPNALSIDKSGVFDTNENSVEDVRNLEYGKEYIFEWYSGSDYNEERLVANCGCYGATDEIYEIPTELTKSGYYSLDISSLTPGFYIYGLNMSSVFEVTD